jgi:CheY-like chemotaxis protein
VTVLRRELDAAAASGHPRARPGTWVEMSVEDNGPGIPPDVLAAMWDPFYSTKPVGTGSGLGLSVVAGIVEQHGGWIAVESTLGVGTVFRCYFPASTPAPVEAGPATPIPTAPPATGRRILLVDDEALVRDVAREMLERAGYDVIECPDGDTAIATLEAGVRPAVVLLDLTMPGLDGWQTLATIRRLTPDLPVVILSGHDPHLSGSGPGADAPEGRVAKPFSRKDLVEAVQRAVRDGRNSAGPSSVGPA